MVRAVLDVLYRGDRMNLVRFKTLLSDFNKINIKNIPTETTFLDISGFPHYENVCSNILKFFFSSDELHGLKDLLVQALLVSLGEVPEHEIIVNDVLREQATDVGNRLDVVILTDDYVIGIENKIYANAYNDFNDYSRYLDHIGNCRKVFKVILSVYSIQHNNSGFINVRYSDFFNNIDDLIGRYWHNGKEKYLIYLRDFMQTIRRIEGGTKMDNELQIFISENLDDVQAFLKSINEMKKQLRQRVQDLGSRIEYDEDKCRQWFWKDSNLLSYDLVHDVYAHDAVIAIDTNTYPIGYDIQIWLRKPGKNSLNNKRLLAGWLIDKGVHREYIIVRDQNREVYCKKFSETNEVIAYLQEILDKICR